MPSTPNSPRNWRELAEQLTSEQIAWLEQFERDEADHPDLAWMTVAIARDYARQNDPLRAVQMRDLIDELVRRQGAEGACRTLNDVLVDHGHFPVSDAEELQGLAFLMDALR